MNAPGEGRWRVERKVPTSLILAMAAQTLIGAFVAGQIYSRLQSVERWIGDNRMLEARLTRLEVQITGVRESLARIERSVVKQDPP